MEKNQLSENLSMCMFSFSKKVGLTLAAGGVRFFFTFFLGGFPGPEELNNRYADLSLLQQ